LQRGLQKIIDTSVWTAHDLNPSFNFKVFVYYEFFALRPILTINKGIVEDEKTTRYKQESV